jgi:hypothetical protein
MYNIKMVKRMLYLICLFPLLPHLSVDDTLGISLQCWETLVGQEVYRLVIIDFLFAIVGASLVEFFRYQICK